MSERFWAVSIHFACDKPESLNDQISMQNKLTTNRGEKLARACQSNRKFLLAENREWCERKRDRERRREIREKHEKTHFVRMRWCGDIVSANRISFLLLETVHDGETKMGITYLCSANK